MTDLSSDVHAEARCEALITEATMLAPELPEAWQTVGNVRISQQRDADARAALRRCLNLCKDLPLDDEKAPSFPTQVDLVRLLIEVGMEREGIEVTEELVGVDDQAVQVWYLGGYGRFVLGERTKNGNLKGTDENEWDRLWRSAYRWLVRCRRLFTSQGCEDERLAQHTEELLTLIKTELVDVEAEGEDEHDDEADGWEDITGDGEEEEDA